jgi:hypothetical protein
MKNEMIWLSARKIASKPSKITQVARKIASKLNFRGSLITERIIVYNTS